MKILVTGGSGQLGHELRRTCPEGFDAVALSSSDLDITDAQAVHDAVKLHKPTVIINAAAYTAVDKAESEPERAYAVNSDGAANIARAARSVNARLVHVSTDFVFDGRKSSPYLPYDTPRPLGVYGKSKLQGENAVLEILEEDAVVVRTSWLYSSYGRNFVKTMLSLMESREEIRVISDQAGTPTWARGLAQGLWKIVSLPEVKGIYHWSDSGIASWYDFACAISEIARDRGLLDRFPRILPINTEEYPVPAKRPSYSVLDKGTTIRVLGITPPHWQENLGLMINELKGIRR